jgi:hypothetical protein
MTDNLTYNDEAVLAGDPEVIAAKAEAAEAEALASGLEDAIRAGDATITHEEITKQQSLVGFLRLQVEGARTKARARRADVRLAAANALREEIEHYASGSGKKFVKLLRAVKTAEDAFVEAVDEHDQKVRGWVRAMQALGIPDSDGRPVPPAEHGRLATGRGLEQIQAGRRALSIIGGRQILEAHRDRGDDDREIIYSTLENADAEAAAPTAQFFYRGRGGGIHAFDVERTPEEIKTAGLVKLTRKEAWGE